MNIKIFLKDRKEALLSMDRKIIEAYCKKYEIELPKDELTFLCAIHKARTGATDLPAEERRKSKGWLSRHGFESMDGGELI